MAITRVLSGPLAATHFSRFSKFSRVLLIALILPSPAQAQHPDTLFYSVVKHGEIAGYQRVWQTDSRHFHSSYQFNDRGRGDSVSAEILTNDSGLVVNVRTTGIDYFKRPFRESFTVEGDSAITVVNDERKSKRFNGELFQSAEPTDIEPGTRFLLRHPNEKISLLAGGTMMMLPPRETAVGFRGGALRLSLCEIYVNDNTPPIFVWIDGDKHFFASASDWFSTIRAGYEPLLDTLTILQLRQSKVYYTKQIRSLADTLPARIAIQHVRLFDAEHAALLEDMTVLIQRDTVVGVGPSSSTAIPEGCTMIDGTGKTLLPGLWDMHSHYQEGEGLNYIAGGVTHVRDMGNANRLPAVRDAIRQNELLGPDISYISGFIDQAGPYQGPTGAIIHTLEEGLKAVDEYAKRGYQQIKLYSSIDPKWVAPLASRAHALGLRVCGHIPAFMTAAEAVNDGYDEITHMNMVLLNFLGDTIDTRTMRRFSAIGEHARELDLNGAQVRSFVSLLQQKHTSLDPTMNVFAGMMTVFPGDTDAAIKPIAGWMPADQRQNLAAKSSFAPAEKREMYDASFDKMLRMLKKLYDSGILIVAGTDGGEAFALEHELELYVQAGIPPGRALQFATYNAAKDCNLLNVFGTVASGRPADLVLVDGNPVSSISDIRRVEWVIKNHLMFHPKKLLASIGWSYYY